MLEGWYDPHTGEVLPDNHRMYYQYNLTDIQEPFHQEEGTIYWLEWCSGIDPNSPSDWGWKSSVNHWNDDAVWRDINDPNMVWHDMFEPSDPITDTFYAGIAGGTVSGSGSGYNGGYWYYYPDTGWWNQWFYDGFFEPDRVKTVLIEFDLVACAPGYIEIALNYSTDAWPEGSTEPPLPGVDEDLYIERVILLEGDAFALGGHHRIPYVIRDYNPEWVSIDIRPEHSAVAEILNGMITHDCRQSLDLAFVITGEVEEEPRFEFSLDIGSDIELSDPVMDGDEAADAGDVYEWQSAPIIPPGRDGFKDDMFIFGQDPWPDPPDPFVPPATRVPVGSGGEPDYWEYFDLDGHDQIDIDLTQAVYPFDPVPSQCIWQVYYLLFSYDDDMWDGWPNWDVPVVVPSSSGVVHGTTGGKDEVLGINLMPTGLPAPYPIQVIYPYADEVTVHASMAPNPDFMEEEDDDVDSLDVVRSAQACPFWYFSPDHEAHWGLDPGGIYLASAAGWPVQVIDEWQLGISEDADIDAFEFVWHLDPEFNQMMLGLVFSVDEDDFVTGADESGGLNPRMIYASSMTGWYWELLDEDRLWDDVDALTAWHTALGGCPNPGGSGNYCLADCFPNDGDGVWDYAVDGDCIINIQDLATLLANYGMTAGATREQGDVFPLGGDGAVNIQDLATLLSQYGDNCN